MPRRKLNGISHGSKNSGKTRETYVCDFETTTDPEDCRVWAWGFVKVSTDVTVDDVSIGTDIDSLVAHLIDLSNTVVYFHNLAFDGSFILDKILREGYRNVESYPRPGEFTSLISNDGKFYSINIKWRSGGSTEFRDSLKKLPMSVANIARSFKLPLLKLSIDYDEYRPPGHELTDIEREYIAHDVVIVAKALAQQFNQGMKKLTVGADSLAEYKRLFGGAKAFERVFPVLNPSLDADIRQAYRGGWTYADKRFQGKLVGSGAVYDVNSLYPSVMSSALLPYGDPVWCDGDPDLALSDEFPLYVASLTFTAKLKPNHVPCIQVKGSTLFSSTEYLTEIDTAITMSCTNIDLDIWREHYEIDILTFNGAWLFKGAHGFFDDYVGKWSSIKENTDDPGLRMIAKLHLNSLYGKFATNPDITGKIPVLRDGVLKLVQGPKETRDPIYTPMGVFITAYARQVTLKAAQANYDVFAYADTDSVHLLSTDAPKGITVDPTKLGAWKREYVFDQALFWRAKTYSELATDGTMHTHIAGLPDPVSKLVTFDDYYTGKVFTGKLLPRRVPGGIVLVETNFSLKGH